ncbi:ribosomal RNA small subunit methyltransferase A [Candidatus Sumerlaeota bacterium]|nr:ribosomal RNA small subunit methyltransferase A [Candidatus Sumerlaeota bacterium]
MTIEKRRRSREKMSRISRLLSEAGLGLRKSLGQHFLVSQSILEKIANAALVSSDSIVLEIGCGVGNLTELLARRAGQVLSVELDERFAPIHRREFAASPNVSFVYDDFMRVDLEGLLAARGDREVWVTGNIPYRLTSPILFRLLASRLDFAGICLLVQREVADRLAACPGSRDYGILAVKTRTRYDVEKLFAVAPGSFLPPPRVHSALVRLRPRPDGPLISDPAERAAFFAFVDAAFGQRRKMLVNSLAAGSRGILTRERIEEALGDLGHSREIRPEQLSTEGYVRLFESLAKPQIPTSRKTYLE